MTLSSRANRKRGFTLAELLVASSATVLLLAVLCGIYMSVAQEWQRQQGQGDALVATSRACSAMSAELSQAMTAQVVTLTDGRQVLGFRLPSNKVGGVYTPVWSSNALQYSSGEDKAFYLSDSSGNINSNGNILWRGCVTWSGSTANVTPDSSWDANAQRGRISPLGSMTFTLDDSMSPRRVTINVSSSYKLTSSTGTRSTGQVARSRTVYMRNTN